MSSLNRPIYQAPSLAQSLKHHHYSPTHTKERLIADFKCMLSPTSLIPGHLYCRKKSLAFYADSMRGETKVLIPFDDILRIKKPAHLGHIDNAIQIICQGNKEYTFVQFPNRDAAYTCLTRLFRAFVKENRNLSERKFNSNSPSDQMSENSLPSTPMASKKELEELFRRESEIVSEAYNHQKEDVEENVEVKEQEVNPALPNLEEDFHNLRTVVKFKPHETITTSLPMSVDQAYGVYFEGKCDYYSEYLSSIGASNVRVGKWSMNEQTHKHEREVLYNKTIKGIFFDTEILVKSHQCSYKQSNGAIKINTKTKYSDVPYAENYFVKESLVFSPVEGLSERCALKGLVNVIFTVDCCTEGALKDSIYEEKQHEHEVWIEHIQKKLRNHQFNQSVKSSEKEKIPEKVFERESDIILDTREIKKETVKRNRATLPPEDSQFGLVSDEIKGNTVEERPIKPQKENIAEERPIEMLKDKDSSLVVEDKQKESEIESESKPKENEGVQEETVNTNEVLGSKDENKLEDLKIKEEDQHAGLNGSLNSFECETQGNTGIFDSPTQASHKEEKILDDITSKLPAKKLVPELEKVKDIKLKDKAEDLKEKVTSLTSWQAAEASLARSNRIIKILGALIALLIFLFIGTTLHLGSRISHLQSYCNV